MCIRTMSTECRFNCNIYTREMSFDIRTLFAVRAYAYTYEYNLFIHF